MSDTKLSAGGGLLLDMRRAGIRVASTIREADTTSQIIPAVVIDWRISQREPRKVSRGPVSQGTCQVHVTLQKQPFDSASVDPSSCLCDVLAIPASIA